MCKWNKHGNKRIDPCMIKLVEFINSHPEVRTLACCCGHGKYDMSIIIKYTTGSDGKWSFKVKDMISGINIPRKKRFYKKDKDGVYYIPEVIEDENN